jgi:hypothetical protein
MSNVIVGDRHGLVNDKSLAPGPGPGPLERDVSAQTSLMSLTRATYPNCGVH